jgi:hypothetical protein
MERQSKIWPVTLAVLISVAGVQTGCAQTFAQSAPAVVAQPAPAPAVTVQPQPTAEAAEQADAEQGAGQPATSAEQPATGAGVTTAAAAAAPASEAGDVAELQRLIRGAELTELRTAYNGSYGASLLFNPKTEDYYAALFRGKTFWRVIKTTENVRAENVYRDFVRQTVQLSNIEIRRIQLDAQNAHLNRLISQSQARVERVKTDLEVARQQQQVVADQQKQTREEANSLSAENTASRRQLVALKRQLNELQRQVDTGLPVR